MANGISKAVRVFKRANVLQRGQERVTTQRSSTGIYGKRVSGTPHNRAVKVRGRR